MIAVAFGQDRSDPDAEYGEGAIPVPGEARVIAQTIDSLLIDPVRLSTLKALGGAYVRSLPRPIETARTLLRKYVAACAGRQSASRPRRSDSRIAQRGCLNRGTEFMVAGATGNRSVPRSPVIFSLHGRPLLLPGRLVVGAPRRPEDPTLE